MKEDYNNLRWQLCEKCLAENNETAIRKSGTDCGGNGDSFSFNPKRVVKRCMENNERWRNVVVSVRANQPMFAVNYQLCEVCPYELEHWLFFDELKDQEQLHCAE